jgi:ADP-ribose pyrophosphatase YjhB (NUDIX family)
MSDTKISVEEAKDDKLFYVVASIIIINPADQTCLLLKRSDSEKVHPGKWGFPGGKLEHQDILEWSKGGDPKILVEGIENILGQLAGREAKEECGLEVDAMSTRIVANKVFVRPDAVPVFLAILATNYTGGDVKLEDEAFTDSAWVKLENFGDYDTIPGLDAEAKLALK